MGYYTTYELEADGNYNGPHLEDLVNDAIGYHVFGDSVKWYTHVEDMLAISCKYPDVLFTLSGAGEEYPDIWRKFFKNGRWIKQVAEITYPAFPEDMLA